MKKLNKLLLSRFCDIYKEKTLQEQEIMLHISDMVMVIYTAESVLARTIKLAYKE
jgi:hypothetical protein